MQQHIFFIKADQRISPRAGVLDVWRQDLLWNGSQGDVRFALAAGAGINAKAAAEAAAHAAVRFVAYDKPAGRGPAGLFKFAIRTISHNVL